MKPLILLLFAQALFAADTVGQWRVELHEEPDGTQSRRIITDAVRTEVFDGKPTLLLICQRQDLVLAMQWKATPTTHADVHEGKTTISMSFDKERVVPDISAMSDHRTVIVRYRNAAETIGARLPTTTTLTFNVPLTSGQTGVAVFSMDRVVEALKELASCSF